MIVLVVLALALMQSPAPTQGTAVLRGSVIDKASGQPMPRAVVSLRSFKESSVVQVYTDDRGQFEFNALDAGSYELRAASGLYNASHVGTSYGEVSPGSMTPITLKNGEARQDLVIALPRALAINGRVLDEAGQPLAGVPITLRDRRGRNSIAVARPRSTNDLGAFRVHGLAPGDYILCAETRTMPMFGAPARRALAYETTCYPSARDVTDAIPVSVTDGDVDGIEIRLPKRPTYVVSGVVVSADGSPLEAASLSMNRFDRYGNSGTGSQLEPDGTFFLSNVRPGSYEIVARTGGGVAGLAVKGRQLWGAVNIEVTTADVEGLVVVMKPGATVKGRVVFDDRPPTPPGQFRVAARPSREGDRPSMSSAPVADDGTFELQGLFGPVIVAIEGVLPRGFVLKSVQYAGSDVSYTPVEFDGKPGRDIEVVLTNRTAELTGRVLDDTGQPAPPAAIVRFPADPAKWTALVNWRGPTSRQDGTYVMPDVPPGDYLIAALPIDAMKDLWWPDDFDRVAAVAERVTVLDNDRRTADLRLSAVPPRRKH